MKKIISSLVLYFFIISSYTLAQFEFEDNFEEYIINQPLACQNPVDWTTWSYLPCSNEDPYITSNFSLSGTRSVKISFTNDLIKLLGNYSTGRNLITFYVYIPNGKTGEISLYSKFNPDPNELAFECYFDVGGSARLMSIPGEPVLFNYTNNQWHLVGVVVDFYRDEAQFYFDNNFIHIWEWTQNGTITSQLAAQNFYGRTVSNELYIDDYYLMENNCLSCFPPTEPRDLTVQQIFNSVHKIQLNWQPSLYWGPRAYKIVRKIGYSSAVTNYETLAYVPFSELQYIDSNVVIDSTYTYGVIAMNMYGYSDTSNFATITVDPVTNLNEENNFNSYSLFQNYPNPFNSSTTIAYGLPAATYVSLIIYDCLGNNVRTLVNEVQEAGTHYVLFESNNLSSGIYFMRIRTDNWDKTKRIIILK
ncbi:MAG: T9SS type A sorting domain-containing protein [Ignavibacteriaceae bacterium]|nr:T9SS type A sorting domain-containing protein [Ignavibacteriaceae bacterium]